MEKLSLINNFIPLRQNRNNVNFGAKVNDDWFRDVIVPGTISRNNRSGESSRYPSGSSDFNVNRGEVYVIADENYGKPRLVEVSDKDYTISNKWTEQGERRYEVKTLSRIEGIDIISGKQCSRSLPSNDFIFPFKNLLKQINDGTFKPDFAGNLTEQVTAQIENFKKFVTEAVPKFIEHELGPNVMQNLRK